MIVNYLNVGGPGNVPPTAAQALNVNTVNVSLSPGSTLDSSQAITHMFNAPPSDISSGWPSVDINPLDTLAAASNWYVLSQAAMFTIVGRQGTTAGIDTANAQVVFSISRPMSLFRLKQQAGAAAAWDPTSQGTPNKPADEVKASDAVPEPVKAAIGDFEMRLASLESRMGAGQHPSPVQVHTTPFPTPHGGFQTSDPYTTGGYPASAHGFHTSDADPRLSAPSRHLFQKTEAGHCSVCGLSEADPIHHV